MNLHYNIYHTYQLLYCKGHIQIRINDSIMNVKTKTIDEQNDKIGFNTLRIYITICYTYLLLYCKGQIQTRSNDSTINVETKSDRLNKMTKLHLIYLEFTLRYITLTSYYIIKDTLR